MYRNDKNTNTQILCKLTVGIANDEILVLLIRNADTLRNVYIAKPSYSIIFFFS